jgi:hypothetical protein
MCHINHPRALQLDEVDICGADKQLSPEKNYDSASRQMKGKELS